MLVNSLFHHYWVPPIVLAEVMEDGEEILRVVDGKQRLTSVQNFFAGIVRKQSIVHRIYIDSILPRSLVSLFTHLDVAS